MSPITVIPPTFFVHSNRKFMLNRETPSHNFRLHSYIDLAIYLAYFCTRNEKPLLYSLCFTSPAFGFACSRELCFSSFCFPACDFSLAAFTLLFFALFDGFFSCQLFPWCFRCTH